MYRWLLRPLLFRLPAETAHRLTFGLLGFLFSLPLVAAIFRFFYFYQPTKLAKTVMGLHFPSPVGLAAGFDKNAEAIDAFSTLGFGFIEIGTVTPKPQAGNDKPRLFRLKADKALINRMGFNNEGLEAVIAHLRRRKSKVIVGGNIGKNKITPNEAAVADYEVCFEALYPHVDYFVVNVSSPNTPGLRELQDKAPLQQLLAHLQELNHAKPHPKPILLKIAPDLNLAQLQDVVEVVQHTRITGIIATNTTLNREGLLTPQATLEAIGAGGLSGAPLREASTKIIAWLREQLGADFVIIGVGGISSPNDAAEKLAAGADLVQVYSGLVYAGPSLIRDIHQHLARS